MGIHNVQFYFQGLRIFQPDLAVLSADFFFAVILARFVIPCGGHADLFNPFALHLHSDGIASDLAFVIGSPNSGIERNRIDNLLSRNFFYGLEDTSFHIVDAGNRPRCGRRCPVLVISHDNHIIHNISLLLTVVETGYRSKCVVVNGKDDSLFMRLHTQLS